MILQIIKGDLFTTNDKCIAHCVSADFKLGAGIAVEVKRRYPVLPNKKGEIGVAYGIKNGEMLVFHLVTKEKYYEKPTYESLKKSLVSMKSQMNDVKAISIPKIGCGLDRLQWNEIEKIIKVVFEKDDIIISVYEL